MSEFRVCEDPVRTLAQAFADEMARMNRACIALSGGSTPKPLYRLWAGEYRASIRWGRLQVFQVDERCVPPDHDASNWKMLRETLLNPVPEIHAFRMQAEQDGAAERYGTLLREHVPAGEDGIPRFDLVLLGMGSDGHTASLFPETPALDERDCLVVRNDAPSLEIPRVTLTFPILEAATRRWFLVTGADKAHAVAVADSGHNPAGRLDAVWFLDEAAAGEL